MAGLKTMNGKPVNMDSERAWYKRICRFQGIDAQGSHIMLVPEDGNATCKTWAVLHGESMAWMNDYELDDGETVADLAAHVRACMPGAEVQAPKGMEQEANHD